MDIQTHILFFTHGLDPVVWLRAFRILLFIISALLMFKEPMICGGQNKFLHRLLSILFLSAAVFNWGIAKARMIVLTQNPSALASIDLMVYEILYTVVVMALVIKLGYDYFKWIGYNKVKVQRPASGNCPHKFEA